MSNGQSVKAVAKYVRISPHKVRQVLDQIRGRSYQEALMILEFLPYDAGSPIWQIHRCDLRLSLYLSQKC